MAEQVKPLRIALLGYGRMGKAIEQEAQARGHQIVARIDRDNRADLTKLGPDNTDVIIEFTQPVVPLTSGRPKAMTASKLA
ncbi:MAG: NAD(P)-binding domain-containing protein [Bacteroidota bacterium]